MQDCQAAQQNRAIASNHAVATCHYPGYAMSTETIFDLMYVHSPITYSIGRHLHDNGYLKNRPFVVCGRNTRWDGPHIEVADDGIWEMERVGDFLETICRGLEEQAQGNGDIGLHLYVPHSGYLAGKLLKLSGLVRKVFYLEEGDAAYNPANVTQAWPSREVDVDALIAMLEARGIMETLKLDRTGLREINSMKSFFFDAAHANYGGAYCISPQAFTLLSNVTVLALDPIEIIPEGENIWLCMLPNIINLHATHAKNKPLLDKMIYGIVMMLRTQSALLNNVGGSLIIKFHPSDDVHLNPDFKNEMYRYGTAYQDFFEMNEFEIGHEPSLYNFSKFVVINPSSAVRYIKQLQGEDKFIGIKLD